MARIIIELPDWFTHEGCRELIKLSTLRCADRVQVTARDCRLEEVTVRVLKDRNGLPS